MMGKTPECPWCGKITGVAYTRKREAAAKITNPELEQIERHGFKTKPLDWHGKIQLAAMGAGGKVLDSGGHPWFRGGGTCSSYTTLHLYALGYIEANPQNFTSGKFGREWCINEAGRKALYDLVGAPATAYPKEKKEE